METSGDANPEGGNTKLPRENQLVRWFFTLKKGEKDDETMKGDMEKVSRLYAYQLESGKKRGFIHYQGMMVLKAKKRLTELKTIFGRDFHGEPLKSVEDGLIYVTKNETRIAGPWVKGFKIPKEKEIIIETLYPWQEEIIEILDKPADKRKIMWIWDGPGKKGKSTFARYLYRRYNGRVGISCTGAWKDIILTAEEDKDIYIVDVPRDALPFEPYVALEMLKNGLVVEAKLKKEARVVDMNVTPHVIVFCNQAPNLIRLSADRWDVRQLV